MSHHESTPRNKTSVWVSIGAVILIILLIVWLSIAMFTGDTDVEAFMPSVISHLPIA